MRIPHSSTVRWWVASLAAYVSIVFLLCPGNPLIGFPVHHDDFSTAAAALGLDWRGPRPVSYALLSAVAAMGVPYLYAGLHLFVIAYASFSLILLRRLLEPPRLPLYLTFFVFAASLSYESTIEYSKYAGLMTGLLSGVFATASMLLITSSENTPVEATASRVTALFIPPGGAGCPMGGSLERAGACARPFRPLVVAGAWGLAALSFWSKEDYVVPVVLLTSYLAWEHCQRANTNKKWALAAAGGMILLAAALVFYNYRVQNVFTQSGEGTYRSNLGPGSIFRTALAYLHITPVATLATALQGSTLVWNAVAGSPVRWTRLFLYHALIAALLLPYACLPEHVGPYYCLNWVVWQIGGALFLVWRMGHRPLVRWVVVGLALTCVAVGQPGRFSVMQWYALRGQINRRIVAELRAHADVLRAHQQVVVEGAPLTGPWFGNTGRFLARMGLDHFWIVRVSREGVYYVRLKQLLGKTNYGRIRTVASEDEALPAGLPVVRISPAGACYFLLPNQPVTQLAAEFGAPRILRLYPPSAAAGTGFNRQPSGQSALVIEGADFMEGATVLFDGRMLQTTVGNPSLISALVPDDLTKQAGVVRIAVRNPDGRLSADVPFELKAGGVEPRGAERQPAR